MTKPTASSGYLNRPPRDQLTARADIAYMRSVLTEVQERNAREARAWRRALAWAERHGQEDQS